MASTAIASGPIVLGFLTSQKQTININILLHRPAVDQASHAQIINLAKNEFDIL
jgi:hypothetical protein